MDDSWSPVRYDENNEFLHYFFAKYPYGGLVIAGIYLYLVKKLLPDFMKNRQAYNLKIVLLMYNVFQVYINCKLVSASLVPNFWSTFWDLHCIPVSPDTTHFYMYVVDTTNLYVYVKILDLFDTAFIVLKKKQNQLSFLHIFHHSIVVVGAVLSFADQEKLGIPIFVLNSFVHIIMYSYYLMSTFEITKWVSKYKKFVTQLQLVHNLVIGIVTLPNYVLALLLTGNETNLLLTKIINPWTIFLYLHMIWFCGFIKPYLKTQFIMVLIYMTYAFINGCPWGYRCQLMWYIVLLVFIYQFSTFYYNEYIVKNREPKKTN